VRSSFFDANNIAIRQFEIKEALVQYSKKRSICKIGLFLYFADKVTGMDKFYYTLNIFYLGISSAPAKLTDPLTSEQVNRLKQIIEKEPVGANSINGDIVELYQKIEDLLSPWDQPREATESVSKYNF